ncbi:hypothetical protein DPMN_045475 [Dreissena polymorpha]|uniref:Uncharacterized protein n=1 Tax=Dreissena polymorpha TaxID=45954 RepID=A0A9D4HZY4_DREPO|nr:hypothetical protein DPMN_045475 [Dreissena polymorpha]
MFRLPYLVNKTNKELQENIPRNEKNISDAYTLWFPFGLLGKYAIKREENICRM